MNRTLTSVLFVVAGLGLFIGFRWMTAQPEKAAPAPRMTATAPQVAATAPQAATPAPGVAASVGTAPSPAATAPTATAPAPVAVATAPAPGKVAAVGYHITDAAMPGQPEAVLGESERTVNKNSPYALRVQLTSWGAGVKAIDLAHYPVTIQDATAYRVQEQVKAPYVDRATGRVVEAYKYPFAARVLVLNGREIPLSNANWRLGEHDSGQARFTLTIADDTDRAVAQLVRVYSLKGGRYDVGLEQSVVNLTGEPLSIRWQSFGPMDPPRETSGMDLHHGFVGHFRTQYDPKHLHVYTDGAQLNLADLAKVGESVNSFWPKAAGGNADYELVWAGVTNRYFATAFYQPVEGGKPVSLSWVGQVGHQMIGSDTASQKLMVTLDSPEIGVPGGGRAELPLAIFVGPKDAKLLGGGAYGELGLGQMIVYSQGGPCGWCTFAWLAEALLGFLRLLHDYVLFDWGLAIIVLVAIIRTLLHPVTRRSQINMQKLSRQMAGLAPELEKLKKKYAGDDKQLQAETMKLYREKGINPMAMGGGCLPMFLQMPIWLALYAMLGSAIELRQAPAFFNVFHHVGEAVGIQWWFLSDMASQDQFITLPREFSLPLLGSFHSLNLLPLLMVVVFWVQQKYMAPPPNPSQSSDQAKQQQMMMKVMTLMFPVFLYTAASGLNLYILTSTLAGIVESKRIRKHIEEEEKAGRFNVIAPAKKKSGGLMAKLQEMQQKALEEKRRKRS